MGGITNMLYLGNTFIDAYLEDYLLEGTNGSSDKLTMEIIDIDKFVKVNDCKPITDPVFLMVLLHHLKDYYLMKYLELLKQNDLVYMHI